MSAKFSKMLGICVTAAALVGPSNSSAAYVYVDKDGTISIEAEHFTAGRGFTEVANKTAKAMELSKCAIKGGSCPMGYMRYNLVVSKAGKYTIWMLLRPALNYYGNEFQFRIDTDTTVTDPLRRGNGAPYAEGSAQHLAMMPIDQKGIYFTRMSAGDYSDKAFKWLSAAKSSRPVQGTSPTTPMHFDIKSPGRHHVEIIAGNEYGFAIDKIVLTMSGTKPTGSGPAETLASTGTENLSSGRLNMVQPGKSALVQVLTAQSLVGKQIRGLDGRSAQKAMPHTVLIVK